MKPITSISAIVETTSTAVNRLILNEYFIKFKRNIWKYFEESVGFYIKYYYSVTIYRINKMTKNKRTWCRTFNFHFSYNSRTIGKLNCVQWDQTVTILEHCSVFKSEKRQLQRHSAVTSVLYDIKCER